MVLLREVNIEVPSNQRPFSPAKRYFYVEVQRSAETRPVNKRRRRISFLFNKTIPGFAASHAISLKTSRASLERSMDSPSVLRPSQ
jgi:hypothetical protein